MVDVTPRVLFTILGIPVRDTVVATWLAMAVIAGLAIFVGRRQPMALEMLVDFLYDLVSDVMRRPADPYLPFLASLAIFITVADSINIFPTIGAPTRDLNTPVALSLVVFVSVHYFGIRANGVWGYVKGLASPIYTLPLELIGQLSRTISLSLRLFGNILSGELVVAVLFALAPLIVPVPMLGFSLFTGVLQAYIFTALAAVYIAAGVEANGVGSSEGE